MVGTKSRGYSNSGQLSEGEYSMPFFSTRHSPSVHRGIKESLHLFWPNSGVLWHT